MLRVGIIGCGGIAPYHIEACSTHSKQVVVAALADVAVDHANALLQKYHLQAGVYTNYKEMIDRESLDFVIINLPHFLHKEVTEFCAENGVGVLLEKPMAMNQAECEEIISTAERTKIKLMVAHVTQYFKETQKAKEIVQSGMLGRLLMVNDIRTTNYFSDRPSWFLNRKLSGGGILFNLGAHSFDRVAFLTQKRAEEVECTVNFLNPGTDIEGYAAVRLMLEEKIPVNITVDGYTNENRNQTVLFFEKGSLDIRYGEKLILHTLTESREVDCGTRDLFEHQLADYIDYFQDKIPCPVSLSYGSYIIDLILRCYESAGIYRKSEGQV